MERTQSVDFTIPILIFLDGLTCMLLAWFAFHLGLDANEIWGYTRLTLLALGIILTILSIWIARLDGREAASPWSFFKNENTKTFILVCHIWVIIFGVYAWFMTYGTFTRWDHTSNYYAQLSDAFLDGRLNLDVKPSHELLTAANPYDPQNRPTQEDLWDMSLYREKIYLYWGAVPALLFAPIQLLFKIKVLDIFHNFFFYAGLVIVNSILLMKLRKKFFPDTSRWTLLAAIALIGLIAPIPWALTPTTIYGAAIGAGQFFLMAGMYFLFSTFHQTDVIQRRSLFLAGLLWTCSIGSRSLNVGVIIFLAALASIWIAKSMPGPFNVFKYIYTIFPLFIPLILGAIAMGWYNWARFDSPLEFGLRYQLTYFNLNRDLHLTFQPDYLPLNAYVYLLQPFKISSEFPFVFPLYTPTVLANYKIAPPKMFFAGKMTGLLFCAPFLLLNLVHVFRQDGMDNKRSEVSTYNLIRYSLAGSFLFGLLNLIFFFFAQMRYLVDVISPITILAVLGYWQLVSQKEQKKSISSKLLVMAANLLLILSICISLLLGITGEGSRMEKLNPKLLVRISHYLSFSGQE